MQVNLLHHPEAFASPAEGFDPAANLRYAIRFLKELRARTGNWADAIAQYHSGEAERGSAYHRKVMLARLGAAWGAGGTVPLPVRTVAGLCAPGSAARPWSSAAAAAAPARASPAIAAGQPAVTPRRGSARAPG